MIKHDLKQWNLAQLLHMHESAISRKMQSEMPEEEQDRIIKIIRENTNNKDGDLE